MVVERVGRRREVGEGVWCVEGVVDERVGRERQMGRGCGGGGR